MPERKKKVPSPDGSGQMVEATILPFQTGGENWNEYLIEDGSVVRLKLVVTEIARIDDQYDQEGNPVYMVMSTNVLAVSSPDELKRGGE